MDLPGAFLLAYPDHIAVACLALLAGLLTLDDTAWAQTWLSQPLPAAVLTGLVCGNPVLGLAVGVPLQLVMMGNLPVGQTFTGEPAPAVVAVVGAACRSDLSLVPALTGQAMEAQGMLGWLLLAAGLLSLAGHWMVQTERAAHDIWMQKGSLSLRDGSLARMEALHLRCLYSTFLRGTVTGAVFLIVILEVWIPAYGWLGPKARFGFALMPLLLPGLGIGTMLERYGLRRSWPWVLGGMLLAYLAFWGGV